MDFFRNYIKSHYLDGKENSKKTKDKGNNKRKRKEKTTESEKRSL